jgi:hypothetical protein
MNQVPESTADNLNTQETLTGVTLTGKVVEGTQSLKCEIQVDLNDPDSLDQILIWIGDCVRLRHELLDRRAPHDPPRRKARP